MSTHATIVMKKEAKFCVPQYDNDYFQDDKLTKCSSWIENVIEIKIILNTRSAIRNVFA
jgi:hypothetical protein